MVALEDSLRCTATTELPLLATVTATSSPFEKPNPSVPATRTLAESRPGLPRRDSRSHSPSLIGCRCGARSPSWRPVKSRISVAASGQRQRDLEPLEKVGLGGQIGQDVSGPQGATGQGLDLGAKRQARPSRPEPPRPGCSRLPARLPRRTRWSRRGPPRPWHHLEGPPTGARAGPAARIGRARARPGAARPGARRAGHVRPAPACRSATRWRRPTEPWARGSVGQSSSMTSRVTGSSCEGDGGNSMDGESP